MSRNSPFDDILREIKESDPTGQPTPVENSFHAPHNITKKLVIIWEDGRKASFVYPDLQASILDTRSEPNSLVLHFVSFKMTLKGYRFDLLFNRFLADEPYIIAVVSERYKSIETNDQFIVTQANVEP
ncbi:hypothetical protein [Niabella hibiscisoli]|uniref:hypothetical protein n=1 Tax=Niabella hibiscisoli TaxID=1825928 RepID=UPI001F107EB7|nr:hypothetical protein [Niabella hibiscisoli]MCH5716695.1 hypothetical protein [Niabella hibiscisoli]